jgi:outer membrane protein assembly factor BamB
MMVMCYVSVTVNSQVYMDYIEEWIVEDLCDDDVKGVTISYETLYVACEKEGLYALDLNGTEKWSLDLGDMEAGLIVGDNETVYTGNKDGIYYSIRQGVILWDFNVGDDVKAVGVLNDQGSIVYVSSKNGVLFALNTSNGEMKWSFDTGDDSEAAPVLGKNNTVLIGNKEGKFYCIQEGVVLWEYDVGDDIKDAGAVDVTDEVVYVGSKNGWLFALDATSGDLVWNYNLNPTHQPTGQPSSQPSGQPSGAPSSPSSQPTGQPSGGAFGPA